MSAFTDMVDLLPLRPPRCPPKLLGVLDDFSYKPGWHFEVIAVPQVPHDPWLLRITVDDQLDAYGSGRRAALLHQYSVPCYLPDEREQWIRWLHYVIEQAESHEIGEWFVVAGERPYDPHKPRP